MKPNGVQRSVRAQRFDRAAGDAPNIGRVARVPGTGLLKGERRRKKRGTSGRGNRARDSRRKEFLLWLVALAVISMSMLGTVLWLWLRAQMDSDVVVIGKESQAAASITERVVSKYESPAQEVALDLVKRALVVRDADEVAEIFRLGSANPEEVVDFLRGLEARDGVVTGCEWLSSMDANGMLLDGVSVNTRLEGKLRNRLAFLTPDGKGQWKIDFDAFARTVTPEWSELMAGTVEQGVVRVMIAPDSYYNGVFRDEKRWSCYGMASPDVDVVLLGYCRKGSPQLAALERIVENGQEASGGRGPIRVILNIQRRERESSKQFEITRVLAEDWVLSATPFDGNFK